MPTGPENVDKVIAATFEEIKRLQAQAQVSEFESYQRAQALILANDMADRIERLAVQGAKDIILPLLCHLDDMLGQARTLLIREKSTLRPGRDLGWH